jgi:hypothetical protein
MGGVALSVAVGTPLVLLLLTLGVVAFVVRDQIGRRRHRVATLDEMDKADEALKADRQRIAGEALRIAAPDVHDDAAAEAEALAESSRRDHAGG